MSRHGQVAVFARAGDSYVEKTSLLVLTRSWATGRDDTVFDAADNGGSEGQPLGPGQRHDGNARRPERQIFSHRLKLVQIERQILVSGRRSCHVSEELSRVVRHRNRKRGG